MLPGAALGRCCFNLVQEAADDLLCGCSGSQDVLPALSGSGEGSSQRGRCTDSRSYENLDAEEGKEHTSLLRQK